MKSKLVFFIGVTILALVITGCGKEAARDNGSNGVPAAGETKELMIIRLAGVDGGFPSPYAHYPRSRGTVMKYVFDSLLEIDEQSYIPWLAEKWEIAPDGRTHLITIRKGVKWHDGKDVTAADVAFSFKYAQKYPPVFVGETVMDDKFLVEMEAVSDYTVKLVTAEPSGTFYGEAGSLRIIPRHIWEGVDNPYEFTAPEAVMGCGPYILTDYSKEHNTYRYEAFSDYWGPLQLVDVLEYVPVSDEVLALEKGEIDLARIPPDVFSRFENNPSYKVVKSPALAGYMLTFNMNRFEQFKDRDFRLALTYAIDKQELIAKIARGAAKPGSSGILPLDHQWYNPTLPQYPYNPEEAKEILKDKETLSFELLVGEGQEVRIGEVLKEQLAKAGIEIRVVSADRQTRDARVNSGQYEIALIAMGSWGLDADYLRVRYASTIDTVGRGGSATALLGADQGYFNPVVDDLFVRQLKEPDQKKRKELFQELQKILAEDVPEIPLYNNYYYTAYRPQKYDGWTFMFDHPVMEHAKLSYLAR